MDMVSGGVLMLWLVLLGSTLQLTKVHCCKCFVNDKLNKFYFLIWPSLRQKTLKNTSEWMQLLQQKHSKIHTILGGKIHSLLKI